MMRQRLPEHATRAERIAWITLVLVLTFVLLIGGTYPAVGSALIRVITQVLVGGLALVWIAVAFVRPSYRPGRTVLLIVTPGVVAGALSVVASPVPRLALEALYWATLWGIGFAALTSVASRPSFRPRLPGLMVLFFLLILFEYLGQLALLWREWASITGQLVPLPLHPAGAALTFGSSPPVATFLLVLGPSAGAVLLKKRFGRSTVFVLSALTVAAVVATGSRASYLAVVAEVAALVLFVGRGGLGIALAGLPRRAVVAAMMLVGGLGAALFVSLGSRLFDTATLSERFDIWKSAVALWERSPLLGVGVGTWPYLRAGAYPTDTPSIVVPHAQNPAIQLLAECGIVGVLLVGFGLLVMVRALVSEARAGSDGQRRMAAAALIGLAGFAAVSLLDDFVNLPSVLLAAALPVAFVLGGRTSSERVNVSPALLRVIQLATAAGLIAAVAGAFRMNEAAVIAETGSQAANRAEWVSAYRQFEAASRIDPGMPLYRIEAATALAALRDVDGAFDRIKSMGEADGTPMFLVTRARLESARGDRVAALHDLQTAVGRAVGDAVSMLNIGSIAEQLDDPDLARRAYAEAVVAAPSLAASEFLSRTPLRTSAVSRALELTNTRFGESVTMLIRAYASPGSVIPELQANPSGPIRDLALATAFRQLGRLDQASELLAESLRASPLDGQMARLLARIRGELGDEAGAARYGRWAELVGFGSTALYQVEGSIVTTVSRAGSSDDAANYPWAIYWRSGPDVLAPPDALAVVGP